MKPLNQTLDTQFLIKWLVIGFLIAWVVTACAKSQPQPASHAGWPLENWQSSSPEAQGMDSARLVQMFEAIQKDGLRLHSLLIVRNGYLVTEAYWPPYSPGDKHTIESITKSIVGTLVGIAIDRGEIESVDQKLIDFFPETTLENMDEQKAAISLKNLLSMTPGLSCQDLSSAGQGIFRSEDWVQYMLDLPVTDPPGRRWIYCSGAVHLLSAILQQATGVDARSYANTHLFKPLGILEVEEQDWNTDSQGVTNGIAGLYLTPRDLAKYGYLYLNKGGWNNSQVVPEKWVEESTREQAYIGPDDYVGGLDRRFGYLWSIFPDQKMYGYLGMAGQELYIVPEKNLVIVFNGALEVGKEAALLRLVNEYIVPAATSEIALPPAPRPESQLKTMIESIGRERSTTGAKQPVPPLPKIAQNVTDKTFVLDSNPLGWKDMTFSFQPASNVATLKITGSPDLQIGLDGQYRLTDTPDSRPVGLKGAWETPNTFVLQHILKGEFVESLGRIEFEDDGLNGLTLTIRSLNYPGPPLVIRGKVEQ